MEGVSQPSSTCLSVAFSIFSFLHASPFFSLCFCIASGLFKDVSCFVFSCFFNMPETLSVFLFSCFVCSPLVFSLPCPEPCFAFESFFGPPFFSTSKYLGDLLGLILHLMSTFSDIFFSVLVFSVLGFSVLGFSVLVFSVLGFSVLVFSVLGFSVLVFSVLGFSVFGFSVLVFSVLGFSVFGFSVLVFSVLGFFLELVVSESWLFSYLLLS